MSVKSVQDPIRIKAETELESNLIGQMRQMLVGMTISIAILVYFENNGNILKNYVALLSLILLFVTSITIGIMGVITYNRRRQQLVDDGIIDIDRTINKWYIFVAISTIVSLSGIALAIVMNKYRRSS
jgi:hypothetical protein